MTLANISSGYKMFEVLANTGLTTSTPIVVKSVNPISFGMLNQNEV